MSGKDAYILRQVSSRRDTCKKPNGERHRCITCVDSHICRLKKFRDGEAYGCFFFNSDMDAKNEKKVVQMFLATW